MNSNSNLACVIVDVDGTLVDVSGIRHYVAGGPQRDFDAFHRASALCPPIPATLQWVDAHRAAGHKIIVVTARQRRYEFLTRQWIRKFGIAIDGLHMRRNDDRRPDAEVKREILARIRTQYEVVAAIDDNPGVIALWESESIPVTVVPGWGVTS